MRVSYVGVPANVGMSDTLPEVLKVHVRDAGGRLVAIQRTQPVLTLDLSDQFDRDKGNVHVSSESLNRSLTDLLPGTANVQDVEPKEIRLSYQRQSQKTVPVELRAEFEPAPEYMISGNPQPDPARIILYGSRQTLDTIRSIATEALRVTGICDSSDIRVPLVCPAGVRTEQPSVSVRVPVVRFTEKILPVEVHCTGVPAGEQMRIFPQKIDAVVRVPVQHYNDIGAHDIEAVCTYPHRRDGESLPVELRYRSPLILSARANPAEVEYLIEK